MKVYIIAGEASGDLHAADLLRELKAMHPDLQARAWGGDLLKAQGATIVKHYKDLAFMGFTEVLLNLRTILRNINFCKKDILEFKPDAIILVDYPGFNLRIAEFAKRNGFIVYYYISPQVWAWKSSRVKKIRENVKRLFVILPFEKIFYKKYNYDVEYVGHPLTDVIQKKSETFSERHLFLQKYSLPDIPIISLLPGSRKQEIKAMLPLMLAVVNKFPNYQFIIAGAPSQKNTFYKEFIKEQKVFLLTGITHELLHHSHAALVTSGTATLETALLNIPEVVCYKGGKISYYIARSLVKINFISLVNLILNREVVKELIQNRLTVNNLEAELQAILNDENRKRIFKDYVELREKLSRGGAAARTAGLILDDLKKESIF